MKKLFCVQWTGCFGFIKPFSAVRDIKVYSQQFLTESIISGMEMKMFPELIKFKNGYETRKIKRHRLRYQEIVLQQETIQSAGMKKGKRETSIVERGILINPVLTLAFDDKESAERALKQHLFLCRNEDILYPIEGIIDVEEDRFDIDDKFRGFELIHGLGDESFLVGFNRFKGGKPMYGKLIVFGDHA